MLTFGSLFAGIGGIDLGLERVGMVCKWQVEIDDYANKVLEKHWEDVKRYRDIRECGKHNLEPVDVITGGFPCQDVSIAGKGEGLKEGTRSGLWFEMRRIVSELRPKYVFVENVPGLLVRGMGTVLGNLSEIGYNAEWQVLSARQFGAWHLRKRVWIVGYAECGGFSGKPRRGSEQKSKDRYIQLEEGEIPDTDDNGSFYLQDEKQSTNIREHAQCNSKSGSKDVSDPGGQRTQILPGGEFAKKQNIGGGSKILSNSESAKCKCSGDSRSGRNGFADSYSSREQYWATEPDVGRVAHGIPNRVDRLKCLGNAVVPQCAEYVGRLIVEHFKTNQ